MKVPSRRKPIDEQNHADRIVASTRPSMPCADRRRDEHDEGAGRSADLEAAAAERRDEEAADDRGVEARGRGVTPDAIAMPSTAAGRRSRRSARRSRRPEVADAVALAQHRHELGRKSSRNLWAARWSGSGPQRRPRVVLAGACLNRTPRPPPALGLLTDQLDAGAIESLDDPVSVSITPRTLPSLASIRWIVGSDTPESSASCRWSIPSRARALRQRALSCSRNSSAVAQLLMAASRNCIVVSPSLLSLTPSTSTNGILHILLIGCECRLDGWHHLPRFLIRGLVQFADLVLRTA